LPASGIRDNPFARAVRATPDRALSRPSISSFLLRRRQVWLPTVWGWLLLLVVAALLVLTAGRFANRFLAPTEPAAGARTLVVEGWLDAPELDQAMEALRRGHYERVVTTGGPLEELPMAHTIGSYAELAADYLRRRGLRELPIIAVPAHSTAQDRTFLSAVAVREWARVSGIRLDSFDVFSAGAHARRSRLAYRLAFGPEVDIGVIAARQASIDADRWWASSSGVKATMGETLSLGWTLCCFWPPAAGSHGERSNPVGTPASAP
jgi:hypothetical protein